MLLLRLVLVIVAGALPSFLAMRNGVGVGVEFDGDQDDGFLESIEPVLGDEFDDQLIQEFCTDRSPDCSTRIHLCRLPALKEVMMDRCPMSCNFCKELIALAKTPNFDTTNVGEEENENEEDEPVETVEVEVVEGTAPGEANHVVDTSDEGKEEKGSSTDDEDYESLEIRPTASTAPPTTTTRKTGVVRVVGSDDRHRRPAPVTSRPRHGNVHTHRVKPPAPLPMLPALPQAPIHSKPIRTLPRAVTTPAPCKDTAVDCALKSHLCYNLDYIDVMNRFCRKTCQLCSMPQSLARHIASTRRSTRIPRTHPATTTARPRAFRRYYCRDRNPSCPASKHLCNNPLYFPLMGRNCARSCGFC